MLGRHRILVLLLGLGLLGWSFMPGAQRLEHWLYAQLSAVVPAAETPVNTLLVTLENRQVSYPLLAELLTRLQSARVAAVGIAVPLHRSQTSLSAELLAKLSAQSGAPLDPQLRRQLDPDAELQAALAALPGLVLAATPAFVSNTALAVEAPANRLAWLLPVLSPGPWPAAPPFVVDTTPLAIFSANAVVAGSALFARPLPAVLVSAPLALRNGESPDSRYTPGFELALAATALGVPMDAIKVHPGTGLEIGTAWYATDAALRIYPRLSSASRPIPRLSAEAVLAGDIPNQQLRGKTVLVGLADTAPADSALLPGGMRGSGLDWSARTVNALTNVTFVSAPYWSLGVQRGVLLLILVYLLILPARLRSGLGLAVGLGLAFLLLNAELLLLILRNTSLPLGLPVLFLLLGHSLLYAHRRIGGHYYRLRDARDLALVELSNNLRAQGRLDTAHRRLTVEAGGEALREALYQLGLDFERRRQFAKALAVYERIAEQDDNYRDIRERRARHQSLPETSLASTTISHASTRLVVDDPAVARPVLGRYEIERELGRGAMGTVYLGRDPRISRTVAIKTLAFSEEFESEQLAEVRRRFFQEAETAGRLNHPNIVTIYDVGEEHDLAYIAMDYISGESLDRHVRPEALLPIAQVFAIGVQVAEALDYAHAQKVVHRDVKPGNIIFDLDRGQLKVTDFGIACLTDNSRTRTGTVLGSPFYMSPEQIAGKKVDGRSDLFSLGVTLYQLLTGQLPFEGDSLTSLMYQITHEKPRPIRKLRPQLPNCVTRMINRALEKQPDKRYANGQAMAEAIRRCAEQL
ncbi:MAG: protein kinase [Gammaproteobacteria bacterium]|nr:protein kinase [Gammaproteobacteria bacterium]